MHNPFSRSQRGWTLLELMLSMSIGLLLLMALGALMMTSNHLAISRSVSERLDDNARQIFWRLEQDLRHAGYVDTFTSGDVLKRTINLKDDTILHHYLKDKETLTDHKSALTTSVLGFITKGKIVPLRGCGSNDLFSNRDRLCTNTDTTTMQSLMISYQVLRSGMALEHSGLSNEIQEGTRGSESGTEEGCSGVSANDQEPLLTHIYGLHQGGLSCIAIRNNLDDGATTQVRSASQPILSNVEEMMFRYLVVPEAERGREISPDQSIYDYLTAKQVEQSALGWSAVVGVEVCLVLAGEALDGHVDQQALNAQDFVPTCQRADRESYDPNALWANHQPRPKGDQRLYRRYHRVLSTPNHLHFLNIAL